MVFPFGFQFFSGSSSPLLGCQYDSHLSSGLGNGGGFLSRVNHGSKIFVVVSTKPWLSNFKPAESYLLVGYVEDMIGGRLAVANSLWFSMNRLFFFPFYESCRQVKCWCLFVGTIKSSIINQLLVQRSQVEIAIKPLELALQNQHLAKQFQLSIWLRAGVTKNFRTGLLFILPGVQRVYTLIFNRLEHPIWGRFAFWMRLSLEEACEIQSTATEIWKLTHCIPS